MATFLIVRSCGCCWYFGRISIPFPTKYHASIHQRYVDSGRRIPDGRWMKIKWTLRIRRIKRIIVVVNVVVNVNVVADIDMIDVVFAAKLAWLLCFTLLLLSSDRVQGCRQR
jgi:hypothetical protein